MIKTILLILSILGIIALCLLGLLLLVLVFVLFWPISYKIQGMWEVSNKYISIKVGWLLGLFKMIYIYPGEDTFRIKLLGFSLLNKQKSQKQQEKQGVTVNSDANTTDEEEEMLISENIPLKKEEQERKPRFWERIKSSIRQFLFKIKNFCGRIKDIFRKVDYYKEVLFKQENKELYVACLQKLGKIWKNIKPRLIDIKGVFGFDTPDKTGMVYGAYCSIRPWLGKKVIIFPDFEQSILQGKFLIKGHISVFILLFNGLRIYFDKRLKRLIKQLKADTGGVENVR